MPASASIAHVLLATAMAQPASDPEAPGSLGDVIDNVFDMAGENGSPAFTYARPVRMDGGAVIVPEGTTRGIVDASLVGLRFGQIWGRVDALEAEGAILWGGNQASFHWGATALQAEDFVACRDASTGGYSVVFPVLGELSSSRPPCAKHDWFGTFFTLGRVAGQAETGHVGLRIAELGPMVDLLGDGRTYDIWRNRLELRLGAAAESVWFGSTVPPGASTQQWAARGVAGIVAAASTDSRRFRASLDATWRPNFADWHDETVEASVTAATFFGPMVGTNEVGIMLGLRYGLLYATRPATTISVWADTGQDLSMTLQLVAEALWWGP